MMLGLAYQLLAKHHRLPDVQSGETTTNLYPKSLYPDMDSVVQQCHWSKGLCISAHGSLRELERNPQTPKHHLIQCL
jgi:hypothetical protein